MTFVYRCIGLFQWSRSKDLVGVPQELLDVQIQGCVPHGLVHFVIPIHDEEHSLQQIISVLVIESLHLINQVSKVLVVVVDLRPVKAHNGFQSVITDVKHSCSGREEEVLIEPRLFKGFANEEVSNQFIGIEFISHI